MFKKIGKAIGGAVKGIGKGIKGVAKTAISTVANPLKSIGSLATNILKNPLSILKDPKMLLGAIGAGLTATGIGAPLGLGLLGSKLGGTLASGLGGKLTGLFGGKLSGLLAGGKGLISNLLPGNMGKLASFANPLDMFSGIFKPRAQGREEAPEQAAQPQLPLLMPGALSSLFSFPTEIIGKFLGLGQ
jgi:hypothetical protein